MPPKVSKGKEAYYKYMGSQEWLSKRAEVLLRDESTCRAPGCEKHTGLNVHHRQYPVKLGDEPIEWLFTLCTYHHMEVHKLAKKRGVSLKQATDKVLSGA